MPRRQVALQRREGRVVASQVAQAATCAPTVVPGVCVGCQKPTHIPFAPLGFAHGYACDKLVGAAMPAVQGAAGVLVEAFGRALGFDRETRQLLGGAARVVVGVAQSTAAQRMQIEAATRAAWTLRGPGAGAAPSADDVEPPVVEVIDVTPRKA